MGLLVLSGANAQASDVLAVQEALAARGYPVGDIDGLMGQKTRAAIRGFEVDNDLPATGEISQQLITLLEKPRDLAPIVLRPPPDISADDTGAPEAYQSQSTAVESGYVNRNWLVQDYRADGQRANPPFALFLKGDGSVAGPRFAANIRWREEGGRVHLRYRSAVGMQIVRQGALSSPDRIAGEAEGPDGAVWRWTAEAKPKP